MSIDSNVYSLENCDTVTVYQWNVFVFVMQVMSDFSGVCKVIRKVLLVVCYL